MNKKYQIFISSTYDDLKKERDQVIKAILEMGRKDAGVGKMLVSGLHI